MRYRLFGRTGLYVSELCFGAMTFGGKGFWEVVGKTAQEEADRLVGLALEGGINFFDTADVYSEGESEKILGKALGTRRRDVVLATKVRGRVGPGPNQLGLSRRHILESIEGSLRRLGTDWVDLYQIHGFDAVTPLDETLRALDDVVRAGKVRYVGCSNLAAWQIAKANGLAARHDWERFESLQAYYTIAGRDLEREIVPLLKDENMGLMVWSPLAGGLLSGKFSRNGQGPAGTRRAHVRLPAREQGPRVRLRRRDEEGRRRARRERGAGGPRVAALEEPRLDDHHRGEERGAAQGQPRRHEARSDGAGGRGARRSQRAAPRVPRMDARAAGSGRVPEGAR